MRVLYRGQWFRSYHEAGVYYGLRGDTVKRRLARKQPLEPRRLPRSRKQ